MAQTIKEGTGKKFFCKIGLHRWGRWLRHSIMSSSCIDVERKCKKCGQIKRKTIPRDFEFGYKD
ncbi:MAG: hypothetical protein M1416_00270, partial [Candidatus Pacearchaeota archaeon]|nr:hypothetical protein [Candidatus Pacearchaeota archaeon]